MPKEDYLVTIGLEVHCQLRTASKMFCGCAVRYGDEPNTLTCPVCLGLPGALPVLNAGAIEGTIVAGMCLGCTTPPIVKWDRKSYFYPDMPKNYQTTQFDLPLCLGGGVPLYESAYPKDWQKKIARPNHTIGLTRIHLEEDVGKSTHHGTYSTLDFNRAGTPLMELVSEPEIESAEEAVAYISSLRQILVYADLSDADMEKGQMRCDVNISLRPKGQEKLGAKIELKNLNSVSAIRRAIHHEIERQAEELDLGIPQVQSTRRWDDERGETTVMRTKEDAHDYRYLPCPDLLPLHTAALVEAARKRIPELPHEKRKRFLNYGLTEYNADVLSSEKALADYFDEASSGDGAAHLRSIANWIINELLSALNAAGLPFSENPVSSSHMAKLAAMVDFGRINGGQAKEVFAELFHTGTDPEEIVKIKGFEQLSDTAELAWIVGQVLMENTDTVAKIKAGNPKAINALKGQVMKRSQGKANPKIVDELLEARLKE